VDSEYLQRLRAGDERAFDAIYRDYYKGLYAFAANYISEYECEEVIQDVMMWLWENRSSLIPGMSLRSLLFTIVRNKCLNRITHLQIRQKVHHKLYAKYFHRFEDPDFYATTEIFNSLTNAIDELPQPYREAFIMNRFQNFTYNEIAEKAGVSAKTVAYRISRSLLILREKLKDYMVVVLF
jgi:RNA polymerase sigma-70 factor (ECF subfamily)